MLGEGNITTTKKPLGHKGEPLGRHRCGEGGDTVGIHMPTSREEAHQDDSVDQSNDAERGFTWPHVRFLQEAPGFGNTGACVAEFAHRKGQKINGTKTNPRDNP